MTHPHHGITTIISLRMGTRVIESSTSESPYSGLFLVPYPSPHREGYYGSNTTTRVCHFYVHVKNTVVSTFWNLINDFFWINLRYSINKNYYCSLHNSTISLKSTQCTVKVLSHSSSTEDVLNYCSFNRGLHNCTACTWFCRFKGV